MPNWVATAFSLIVWPLVLVAWQHRRVNSVPGLEVHLFRGTVRIGSKEHAAVDLRFTNHTGSVAYVRGVRIKDCTAAFSVPTDAARDVSADSYHLKFNYGDGDFKHREVTLQTNESAQSCMPVESPRDEDFFKYKRSLLARVFRRHRYFVLEYTVLVGSSRHLVTTRY